MTTLEKKGARLYFRDAPFSAKDALKEAGCHWDAEERAWWIGAAKKEMASTLLAKITAAAPSEELPPASGELVEVSGNTYPVRDQLRAMGGSWDASAKVWRVPESRLAAAQALVAKGASSSEQPRTYRPSQCKQCGARPGPRGWPRIYKNGICSDCYRDSMDD